jgi:hypothetical protein
MGGLGFAAGLLVGGLVGVNLIAALSSRDGAAPSPEALVQRGQDALRAARERLRQAVQAARDARRETRAMLQAEWERAKRGEPAR